MKDIKDMRLHVVPRPNPSYMDSPKRFHLDRHDVGATGGFEQRTGIGGIGLVAFDIGSDVGRRQQLNLNAQSVEPTAPMVGQATGFHDHQPHIPIVEPAFELAAGQPFLPDNFPFVISNGNLEYTLGQINCNGSSMHFGLLSSKTDPHPHEHRYRLLGDEKTGSPSHHSMPLR
ncbi:MAG: hypothetical protein QM756_23740 [Polyangiaceae bacterium]